MKISEYQLNKKLLIRRRRGLLGDKLGHTGDFLGLGYHFTFAHRFNRRRYISLPDSLSGFRQADFAERFFQLGAFKGLLSNKFHGNLLQFRLVISKYFSSS